MLMYNDLVADEMFDEMVIRDYQRAELFVTASM